MGSDINRFGIAFRVRVAQNVNWIVVAPVRRQKSVQGLYRLFGKNGQFSAICDKSIGGQNCGPAGIGENRKRWPLRTWLLAENFCHVKQVRDGADAQHARTTEGGIKNLVTSGQGPS